MSTFVDEDTYPEDGGRGQSLEGNLRRSRNAFIL